MILIHCNNYIRSWKNKKDLQIISKIKPFINKYNWKGISVPSEKDDWKRIGKNNRTTAHNFLCPKKEKYILLMFQNITHIVKKSYTFNEFKWHNVAVKNDYDE